MIDTKTSMKTNMKKMKTTMKINKIKKASSDPT